jgi:hypothetical protein
MPSPNVFISYSYDSDDHRQWVKSFATALRKNRVNAVFDEWDAALGQDLAEFMSKGIASADRVLLICSERYAEKSDRGDGGVGYERLIVTAELLRKIDTHKFIPVMRENNACRLPIAIGARKYIDFNDDSVFDAKLAELTKALIGTSEAAKPPLGTGSLIPDTAYMPRNLSSDWFGNLSELGRNGLGEIGASGGFELRLAPTRELRKTSRELYDAVEGAQVKTFGWPLGVVISNRAELAPKPVADGVRTRILTDQFSTRGHSFDLWHARINGEFYLLQSYFEDRVEKDALFFDTQIVKATEAFLFANRFYRSLGLEGTDTVAFRISHSGLRGRTLKAANRNRLILPHEPASELLISTDLTMSLDAMLGNLADHVRAVCAPLFTLFDFTSFPDQIYDEISSKYANGVVP